MLSISKQWYLIHDLFYSLVVILKLNSNVQNQSDLTDRNDKLLVNCQVPQLCFQCH